MIWFALALGALGLGLSAFFSGSETGFYRLTRIRLVLDALEGDPVARGLFWLASHPAMFVATTLVGNNLANYLVSLAVVMGVQAILYAGGAVSEHGHAAELIAPLALSPLLFVYGELLPKNLFLHAPNRLLRAGGPLLLMFVVVFFPVSVFLWGLNWLLSRLVGQAPVQARLTLARRELRRILEEGHEAGVLYPSQFTLARGIFALANDPALRYATPLEEVPRARSDMSKEEVCRLARRLQISDVPLEDAAQQRLVGYVRVIELSLSPSDQPGPVRPLLEVPHTATHLEALMRLQSAQESLARIVDDQGQTLGILTARRLRAPLFRRER